MLNQTFLILVAWSVSKYKGICWTWSKPSRLYLDMKLCHTHDSELVKHGFARSHSYVVVVCLARIYLIGNNIITLWSVLIGSNNIGGSWLILDVQNIYSFKSCLIVLVLAIPFHLANLHNCGDKSSRFKVRLRHFQLLRPFIEKLLMIYFGNILIYW